MIGASVSGLITIVLRHYISGIGVTPEILLRAMRTPRDVALNTFVAISAGAAASLALVAQQRASAQHA